MKKGFFSLGFALLISGTVMAQNHQAVAPAKADPAHQEHFTTAQANATPATTLTPENLAFTSESHDFGTIAEGGAAEYVFQFKNTGKEPVTIQRVQPSCGCTIPDWTKEPIAPGKTGMVKASYGTQGRPGQFNKTLTVFSNAGTKMLTIQGNVEKTPENSVPENTSMIRTN